MRSPRPPLFPTLLLGALLALFVACAPAAQPSVTPTTGAGPTPTPTVSGPSPTPAGTPGGVITHATGQGDVILQWWRYGGFVPYLYRDLWVPLLTVYGDGTVLYVKYDEMKSENVLLKGQLGEKAIQALLADAVNGARFFTSKDSYFNPYVADAPDTKITVRAAGKDVTVVAYGLMDLPGFQKPADWSDEDAAQWDRLVALQQTFDAFDLRGSTDPDRQDKGVYLPEAAVLYVENLGDSPTLYASDWTIAEIDLAAIAPTKGQPNSMVIEGEAAHTLPSVLPVQGARVFVYKGVNYQVGYRPRLPFDWTWNGGPPPHVGSVTPQPFASLDRDGICVVFHFQRPTPMGINPTERVKLGVDGKDVTADVQWITTKDLPTSIGNGCYTPPSPLAQDQHTATLSYTDQAGTSYSYTWEFHVQQ